MTEPATIANRYARAVTAGRTPACKWVRLACARHMADLERAKRRDPAFPFRFDRKRAGRVCRFVELLPHIKGEWAKRGETLRLEPWQTFILACAFGWLRSADGLRRFRTVYLEIPRKNAKSTLSSALSLYMLALDGEAGADCYSAATKREQAKIVFGDATAANGATIDLAVTTTRYNSVAFLVRADATLAEGETLTLAAKIEDSADGSDWADLVAAATVLTLTGATGGSTGAGVGVLGADLRTARRYLRVVATPDLSAADTDTVGIDAVAVLCGADELPVAAA